MNDKIWKVVLPLVGALFALWFFFGRGGGDAAEEARIRAMLDEAVAAWEAQDLDTFMSFFARDFQSRSGGLSYGSLLLYHKRMFGPDHSFHAEVTNVHVSVSGDTATLTFNGRATGSRKDGSRFRIVGATEPVPIVIELRKVTTRGGLSHTWEAIRSTGLEEGYEGSW